MKCINIHNLAVQLSTAFLPQLTLLLASICIWGSFIFAAPDQSCCTHCCSDPKLSQKSPILVKISVDNGVHFHGKWFLVINLTGWALQAWLNSEKEDFWAYSLRNTQVLYLSERPGEWEVTYLHNNSGYSLSALFSKINGKVHVMSSNQSVPSVERGWQ